MISYVVSAIVIKDAYQLVDELTFVNTCISIAEFKKAGAFAMITPIWGDNYS